MVSFINRRSLTVEWGQCDPDGVIFSRRIFEIFDQSTWQLFEAVLGVKPNELAQTFGILGIPLVDVSANFNAPVKFGDTIEVESRALRFGRSSFDVEHKIKLNGDVAAEGVEKRVWAACDKATGKMAAVPVPSDIAARFGTA